jgi:hypothetical protein
MHQYFLFIEEYFKNIIDILKCSANFFIKNVSHDYYDYLMKS